MRCWHLARHVNVFGNDALPRVLQPESGFRPFLGFTDNAIVVPVVHVFVRWMAATDWRDAVPLRFRATDLSVSVVIPHAESINVGR